MGLDKHSSPGRRRLVGQFVIRWPHFRGNTNARHAKGYGSARFNGKIFQAIEIFALARWAGDKWVCRLIGEARWQTMTEWIDERGTGGLLAARLIPVISFNLINYAAGLAGVGWWKFTWTTAVGILPIAIASVLVGSHMIEAPAWLWVIVVAAAAILILKDWTGIFQRRPAEDL